MRVALVNMPWQAISWPSLAISVLDTVLTGLGHEVRQVHGNLRFAEHLLRAGGGDLTPADYAHVYRSGFADGVGEWIFTSALYGPGWRVAEFSAYARRQGYQEIPAAVEMHRLAPEFVAELAGEILAGDPDLVGMTTTFEQSVPSLALARELKRRSPETPIVLGGANCDGPMGEALHRNFPQVDFVVRGEGERPVAELMSALAGDRPMGSVTGLCWRTPDGDHRVNPYPATPVPGAEFPSPNLRPFFAALRASPARPWVTHPTLYLETSRGCWWGEKRQCTFCGLNGGTIAFRVKPAERAWQEISTAVAEFGLLDIMLTDCVLDPASFDTLLPRLAATGWDLRLYYEIKSNLRADQAAVLAAAGVGIVQPGIESLSTGVLALMSKGVTGPGQVGALRLLREHGIYPMWNFLYGFPGEEWDRDYAAVVAQLPALVHLPPPEVAIRVKLERFSPLYDRPELGIDDPRRACAWYGIVYDLPPEELADLAYVFDYRPRGIDGEGAARLSAAVRAWQEGYERSSLTYRSFGTTVVVMDRRAGWPERDHRLEGVAAAGYLALTRHLAVPALLAVLASGGYRVDEGSVTRWLAEWRRLGLVYADRGQYVALAVRAQPGQQASWGEAYSLATL